MLLKAPEDTYKAYQRFLKKHNYKKAYQCLESLLREFPDDGHLLEAIVDLCIFMWKKPETGKIWLKRLSEIRTYWMDYILQSHAEAELGNIPRAREFLQKAKGLYKKDPRSIEKKRANKAFRETEDFINYKEWNLLTETHSPDKGYQKPESKKEKTKVHRINGKTMVAVETVSKRQPDKNKKTKSTTPLEKGKSGNNSRKTDPDHPSDIVLPPHFEIPLNITSDAEDTFRSIDDITYTSLKDVALLIDFAHLSIQGGFDELLCLNTLEGVEKYWYQIETVKKVLKYFHGRVLLCDEVGLGKTIEAGMLIKEYMMRGMAKNVLILTPPPLVSQWKEEMDVKFGIRFKTTDDIEFTRNSTDFWKERLIIASLNTAKGKKHKHAVLEQFYDIVIVDEAHHLRNRTTLAYKLVDKIKRKFIFLLSATPVQNNLIELYNLITLLKPGQFKTERLFKEEYLTKGNLRKPANKEKLRELLRDVMIRNTRSAIDLKLPKRFATTMRLEPSESEREIHTLLKDYLRKSDHKKPMLNLLLREMGSSPYAVRESLLKLKGGKVTERIVGLINILEGVEKGNALIDILKKNPLEKKIIFTQYLKSIDFITDLLREHNIPYVTFRGDMNTRDKNRSIARFRNEVPVLVSTESGGEGRNIQFCNTIVNFDLPWNPMRIEQRIGRLHRIGQTRDVFIFNLSIKETVEDYILDILDSKINMFEMVIGEIEPILGLTGKEGDLEDIILDIWLKSNDEDEVKEGFEMLGRELMKAKKDYINAKALDEEVFGEDYEI